MVDKIEYLKKHGKLPQFGKNISIVVDKDGNTIISAKENIVMKTKTKGK